MGQKDTKKLIKALEAQGFEVRSTTKGHIRVSKNGQAVTTFSGTPSDGRSFKNALAQLKRAGFVWP
ncbi:hypothetical protein IU436_27465 [Nocardia farcinica]|uniref:hypothetical protein n=1 Tax=Nocardia farcinica TaxID=37329 RepID=UPI0018932A16|nr:hypothetical protein [Nocardia farcinica]MBF6422380.1 hypothetical protein [Nocardia farcinica]MBF6434081.1 hypothetical protein [Nocardia farcinica]MBF6505137.1 hypothetical protein [Nocardia farcinica]